MLTVTSVEAQNRFGQLLDTVQREPITITRHGRTAAFIISPQDMEAWKSVRTKRGLVAGEIDPINSIAHLHLISKIQALGKLSNGWLEGRGIAPSSKNINWLSVQLTAHFPDALEYPSVAPTEEGNVSLEWIRPKARIELEVNFAAQNLELYATNISANEFTEQVFSTSDWLAAFSKIEGLLAA